MTTTPTMPVCERTGLPTLSCACLHCRPDRPAAHPEVMPYEAPGTPSHLSDNRKSSRTAPPRPRISDHLGRMLTRAPQVWAELGDHLAGNKGGGESERVTGGSVSKPLPLQAQLAEHRHQLLHDLRWWVAEVTEYGQYRVTVGDSPGTMAALLLDVRHDLDDDDTEALTGTLQDWLGRARMLTERPKLRSRLPLLQHEHVPQDTSGMAEWEAELLEAVDYRCPGLVHALIPADPDLHVLVLECDDCRQRWAPAELPQAGAVDMGLADAAALTGTPLRTLQHWVKRGELEDRGTHQAMVRLTDVLTRRAHTAQKVWTDA